MKQWPTFETPEALQAYLLECVSCEPITIQEEYTRLAADFAFWNERYARAFGWWNELKARRDRVYARLYHAAAINLEIEGVKKPAAVVVDQVVHREVEYQKVVTDIVSAEMEKVRLAGVLEALRTKRDMLVGLGANMRAEMSMSGRYGEKE